MASLAPPPLRSPAVTPTSLHHGRYSVQRLLGEGGMAQVYQALDQSTGRPIALKRLREGAGSKYDALAALFEREFLALSQIKHPRIVEVYDFHVDEKGPFYTMELVEGVDLQHLAPMDYKAACLAAHDVCSALALVHSRRMVYRDLSPSNVRRTRQGLTKLIDFGALASMGACREIVGTLPCVPPEAVGFAQLDGRADLYALGATLYFALVRRHAYPARNLEELVRAWASEPAPPSAFVGSIPAGLDALVMELLSHDRERRPGSASEVMERLAMIADIGASHGLEVERGYLTTPALVGREAEHEVICGDVREAKLGRGSSLLLKGGSGSGRTRMVEVGGLEAMRQGMVVLRADARDGLQGDFGAVRALARGLLAQAPRVARHAAARHAAVLSAIVPELREAEDPASPAVGEELQRALQPALREWFCEVALQCPLAITIDDVERLDAPSAAFVSLMAREARRHPIVLLAARDPEASSHNALNGALHILGRYSKSLVLSPLDLHQTESALGSLFGDTPHLAHLAQHVHRVTRGNPRDVLRLAEHLVNERVIRYEASAWTIPAELPSSALPNSMAEALDRRVLRLGAEARALCFALACEPAWSFSFEECRSLLGGVERELTLKVLHELVSAAMVENAAEAYTAGRSPMRDALRKHLSEDGVRALLVRMASVCAARGDAFREAQYLLRAGENERGLDRLVDFSLTSIRRTDADPSVFHELLRALPDDWLGTFEFGLEQCERLGRPVRDRRAILQRLSGVVNLAGLRFRVFPHLRSLIEPLWREAGLDLYEELTDIEPPLARMQAALARAGARYASTPDERRGLDPKSAIAELAKAVTLANGSVATTSEYADWASIPSLAALVPLSPAIGAVHDTVRGLGLRLGGRSEEAIAVYSDLLRRLAQPDRAGLPASHHLHTQVRLTVSRATLEAGMGRQSCLIGASEVAQEPRYELLALTIQQLYLMFRGNLREAKTIKQRIELRRLEIASHQAVAVDAQQLFFELAAYALAQDMTGVKRAIDEMVPFESNHESLRAAVLYGRGEYQRIRGDNGAARGVLEEALSLMRPGEHLLWANAAGAHVRVLLALGEVERACELGQSYLRQGAELGYVRNYVRAALSLALSRKGEHEAATRLADEGIAALVAAECKGLTLALLYEARAQVASAARDDSAFERYSALHAAELPERRRSVAAFRTALGDPEQEDQQAWDEAALSQLHSTWESCTTIAERVQAGLEVLAKRMGALGGVLFTRAEGGLVPMATYGDASKTTPELQVWASDYVDREVIKHVTEAINPEACAEAMAPEHPDPAGQTQHTPVLLAHSEEAGMAVTGIAVLVGCSPGAPNQPAAVAGELSRCIAELDHVVSEYL